MAVITLHQSITRGVVRENPSAANRRRSKIVFISFSPHLPLGQQLLVIKCVAVSGPLYMTTHRQVDENVPLIKGSITPCFCHRLKIEKKLAGQDAQLVPLARPRLPILENPDYHPKKNTNRSTSRCILRYRCYGRVWNWQVLNQVAESQFFRFLWNRNRSHQCIFEFRLIQMKFFFPFFFQLLIPALTPVSLLKSESGFETPTQPSLPPPSLRF